MMDGGDPPSAKFTLKESISRTFGTGFLDGSITAVSAEKATMAPPGAPPCCPANESGGLIAPRANESAEMDLERCVRARGCDACPEVVQVVQPLAR